MMFSGFEFRAPPKNVRNINKRAEAVKNRPRKPNAAPKREDDGQSRLDTQPVVTEKGDNVLVSIAKVVIALFHESGTMSICL